MRTLNFRNINRNRHLFRLQLDPFPPTYRRAPLLFDSLVLLHTDYSRVDPRRERLSYSRLVGFSSLHQRFSHGDSYSMAGWCAWIHEIPDQVCRAFIDDLDRPGKSFFADEYRLDSVVQIIQFTYQSGLLYRLRSLRKVDFLHITVDGIPSWAVSSKDALALYVVTPFLMIIYAYQFYLSVALLMLWLSIEPSEGPSNTWQVCKAILHFYFFENSRTCCISAKAK